MRRGIAFRWIAPLGLALFLGGAWAQDSQSLPVTIPDQTSGIRVQGITISPNPTNPYTPSSPLAQAWDFLGGTLRTACGLQQGGTVPISLGGFTFPFTITHPPKEIAWICDIADTWRFLNGLVNKDWLEEARMLVGQWTGDLASVVLHSMVLGTDPNLGMDKWSQKVQEFNDKLKDSYASFRRSVYNAIWDAAREDLARLRQERQGQTQTGIVLPEHTQAFDDLEKALKGPSSLGVIGGVERAANKLKASRRAQATILTRESNKPMEKTIETETGEKISPLEEIQASVHNKKADYDLEAKDITGQPLDNTARRIFREVQQAPDTRTAIEGLTKAVLVVAQANLYGDDAIVRALSLIIQQGVLTNRALSTMLMDAGAQAASEEAVLREGVAEVAEQTGGAVYTLKLQQKAIEGLVEGLFKPATYYVAF